jgi:type I restriction-modification system DNA methylase subunit
MPFQKYIEDVQKQFKTGIAREHAYRPALRNLIHDIMPDITAVNDPAHIKCGAPDFILQNARKLEVGYMEAKDVGIDLSKTEKTDQLGRYLESLDNLVLTDYLEFRFYLRGEKVEVVRIGEIVNDEIKALPENYDRLKTLLLDFSAFQGQTIKSAKQLAKMMAHKAKLMKHIFYNVITDKENDSSLKDQLKAFQNVLMHDMTEEQFADVYAQTIAYGLFTARLHDKTKDDFSRSEALLLIPKSNPFLRQLFSYVAGSELDERVVWIVDALCEVFLFSDLDEILKDFGSSTGQKDPMLHFYETFLAEYDKKLRKSRGVWYTPEPVVNFIVRAIDDVLKTHFYLKDGIADKSKIKIEVEEQAFDKRTKTGLAKKEIEVHKVQLLDVATGTGTFLAEAVKQIYKRYKGQEGIWSSYVENDLLPRLHGFELLMASYAMCHMKLDLLLQETGYKPSNTTTSPRLSVYLTNSLEEHHPEMDTLFASWLSKEANDASWIKKNMPIMVAFGNPPYSGISGNMNSWTATNKDGIERYKYVDGVPLNERKHWLNDDYVQFIRLGEHYIEKNGEGVLAYITNHSYLDNPTFRGMRWHLLNTFDDIYIVDLHGNSLKQETCPDGSKDVNVFDIQAGVAIMIGVKKKTQGKKKLATVHHVDFYGTRDEKHKALESENLKSIEWNQLDCQKPFYFFIPQNYDDYAEYQKAFGVSELFSLNVTGIVTMGDDFAIATTEKKIQDNMNWLLNNELTEPDFKKAYSVGKNYPSWILEQKNKIDYNKNLITKTTHRPFDDRFLYFDNKVIWRWREEVMRHMRVGENVGLILPKQALEVAGGFVTKNIITHKSCSAYNTNYLFPLYRYEAVMGDVEQKVPNLDPKIYAQISKSIPDLTSENLFDYIYGVLHAPAYRERYAEFLKSDFPRIPYPENPAIFHALADKGAEIRSLHLMESDTLNELITTYPESGNNEVTTINKNSYRDGNVYINETQYFGNVPNVAWEFYIGGYQPAQKWLKDRKGRELSVDDIMHYQRIVVALTNSDRIMKEIDEINFLPDTDEKG